ncbi:hypothetical protein ENBRE01_2481 [Enteropsectra breve]|nr:hypothetical protein ENBRE01_2481 [Enteropsectra breve]
MFLELFLQCATLGVRSAALAPSSDPIKYGYGSHQRGINIIYFSDSRCHSYVELMESKKFATDIENAENKLKQYAKSQGINKTKCSTVPGLEEVYFAEGKVQSLTFFDGFELSKLRDIVEYRRDLLHPVHESYVKFINQFQPFLQHYASLKFSTVVLAETKFPYRINDKEKTAYLDKNIIFALNVVDAMEQAEKLKSYRKIVSSINEFDKTKHKEVDLLEAIDNLSKRPYSFTDIAESVTNIKSSLDDIPELKAAIALISIKTINEESINPRFGIRKVYIRHKKYNIEHLYSLNGEIVANISESSLLCDNQKVDFEENLLNGTMPTILNITLSVSDFAEYYTTLFYYTRLVTSIKKIVFILSEINPVKKVILGKDYKENMLRFIDLVVKNIVGDREVVCRSTGAKHDKVFDEALKVIKKIPSIKLKFD